MSTATHTPTVSRKPRSEAALDRFDELLFHNPEICSRCFARIRDRTEHDASANRLGTGNRPTETLERAGAGEIGQDVEDHDAYGVRRSYHARTFCGECGVAGGRSIAGESHSLQFLRGCLDRIARRLHESGYYPDLDTLYGTAVTLKTKPDHQRRDRQILATAVYLATERGRSR